MKIEGRSRSILIANLLVYICLFVSRSHSISWLAIGKDPPFTQTKTPQSPKSPPYTIVSSYSTNPYGEWNNSATCSRTRPLGFSKDQRSICQQNLDLMPSVVLAAKQTIDVCQELFAEKRWNCSTIVMAPKYLPDLTGGTKEQAFVHGLAAASLAQIVAKACSSGQSSKCQCSQEPLESPPANSKWGGCGDDVKFGLSFSKHFTEWHANKRRKRSKDDLVDQHNAAVGRKLLIESIKPLCKCHGVSGSCSVKTCFKSLPTLKEIGILLQNRYKDAIKVAEENGEAVVDPVSPLESQNKKSGRSLHKRLAKSDALCYKTISSDYCQQDLELGSVGTRGRECDKNSTGSSGCKSMCCGRGFTSETINRTFICHRRFIWCCEVVQKTCSKPVQIYKCR